ncbi:hypothetical protein [Clostridium sp.]|uniref:hypothetical protein n=1 Tax=Clostridium sp. TaxID=1506 RepID=UPI003994A099
MRVREVNFYGSLSSKIILEDEFKCYLEVNYRDSKSIYIYHKEIEKLIEFTSTSDMRHSFFVDEHRKNVYEYYIKGNFLIIREVNLYDSVEILKYNLGRGSKFIDLFAIDNYIFVIYKNNKDFTKGFIYSIEENLNFEINDRIFLETVGKRIFFKQEDIAYMVVEESYYSPKEILDLRNSYGENEFTRNDIVLYDINELVQSVFEDNKIKKNLLIDSHGKEYVTLLGIYDNKIVVFHRGMKNRLIYFSIDDNIAFRTVNKEIDDFVSKGDFLLISKNKNKKEVINNDNNTIYSYKEIEENTKIRAFMEERILVYSNNNSKGHKNINLYDIFTGDVKNFNCDFLMIDKELV